MIITIGKRERLWNNTISLPSSVWLSHGDSRNFFTSSHIWDVLLSLFIISIFAQIRHDNIRMKEKGWSIYASIASEKNRNLRQITMSIFVSCTYISSITIDASAKEPPIPPCSAGMFIPSIPHDPAFSQISLSEYPRWSHL